VWIKPSNAADQLDIVRQHYMWVIVRFTWWVISVWVRLHGTQTCNRAKRVALAECQNRKEVLGAPGAIPSACARIVLHQNPGLTKAAGNGERFRSHQGAQNQSHCHDMEIPSEHLLDENQLIFMDELPCASSESQDDDNHNL
jgi:hypothetical protein